MSTFSSKQEAWEAGIQKNEELYQAAAAALLQFEEREFFDEITE